MRALRIARGIRPGYAAAVLAFAVDGLYLAVISHQGTGLTSRVAFVSGSIAGAGAVCATAELVVGVWGDVAATAAATTLWIWMMLGLLSIGVAVAPSAVLATIALTRRPHATPGVALGIVAALLIAVAGLAWTPA